jgi:hypothetical protein
MFQDQLGSRTMRLRITGLSLALASSLAGCAPGPAGYADWANFRQHQANDHSYLSRRIAETARWQAHMGDYRGARQSQAAADAEGAEARRDQDHAARDRFFSQF